MLFEELESCLERSPVVSAVTAVNFNTALNSPSEVIFHLNADLLSVDKCISDAHSANKHIFIHLDLAEGLGKDKTAVEYLAQLGADGIITTKAQLVRTAREKGLLSVQRIFALDSKGLAGMGDVIASAKPDLIEIMPGIASKVIKHFSDIKIPIIAGGLIETKSEVTEAISNGAFAVSTGKEELWYI